MLENFWNIKEKPFAGFGGFGGGAGGVSLTTNASQNHDN